MTVRQLAEILGVGAPLVRLVLARRPRPPGGPRGRPRLIKPEQHGTLWAQLAANPAGTVADHAEQWRVSQGTPISWTGMLNTILRLGWRRTGGAGSRQSLFGRSGDGQQNVAQDRVASSVRPTPRIPGQDNVWTMEGARSESLLLQPCCWERLD